MERNELKLNLQNFAASRGPQAGGQAAGGHSRDAAPIFVEGWASIRSMRSSWSCWSRNASASPSRTSTSAQPPFASIDALADFILHRAGMVPRHRRADRHSVVAGGDCSSTHGVSARRLRFDRFLPARHRGAHSGTRARISARFTQTKHLSLLDEPLGLHRPLRLPEPRPHAPGDRNRRAPPRFVINGQQTSSIPGLAARRSSSSSSMTPMAAMFSELGAMFSGSPAHTASSTSRSRPCPSTTASRSR